MENINDFIKKMNDLQINQEQLDWEECIPEDIWNKYFKDNFVTVESEMLINKHRWYETSVDVLSMLDSYVGIRYISNLYSEQMDCSDCFVTLEFFKMKKVQIVSYILDDQKNDDGI